MPHIGLEHWCMSNAHNHVSVPFQCVINKIIKEKILRRKIPPTRTEKKWILLHFAFVRSVQSLGIFGKFVQNFLEMMTFMVKLLFFINSVSVFECSVFGRNFNVLVCFYQDEKKKKEKSKSKKTSCQHINYVFGVLEARTWVMWLADTIFFPL